jgi:3-phosphoshikimate 1-carboxyvinyltransferase
LKLHVTKSALQGEILVPGSKSHSIRAFSLAAIANGASFLKNVLLSDDTVSCMKAVEKMGAEVKVSGIDMTIKGLGGNFPRPASIDVGNSGTTLRILTAMAALSGQKFSFDGDKSIRKRLMVSLFKALQMLGATIEATDGKCPFTIQGPLHGGETEVDGISSQFLTAVLLTAPLIKEDTIIKVHNLHEKPYVEITLGWLDRLGIEYENKGLEWFRVKGNQQYKGFEAEIPADFSSACFALCAAAVTQSKVLVKGLDFGDFQGDKVIFDHFQRMGATIEHKAEGVWVTGKELTGIDIDMNATPDALPVMAVAGCLAKGTTRLLNVKQARLKECDRISAMFTELTKMGASIEELEDGLVIHNSPLKGTALHGYDDHRMVMALSIAGMCAQGDTIIDTAESINVTYPTFIQDFMALGAKFKSIF